MDNLRCVSAWLRIATDAPAAVYFNEANKSYVLQRQGSKALLLSAPSYADDLSECLIYLDEVHT